MCSCRKKQCYNSFLNMFLKEGFSLLNCCIFLGSMICVCISPLASLVNELGDLTYFSMRNCGETYVYDCLNSFSVPQTKFLRIGLLFLTIPFSVLKIKESWRCTAPKEWDSSFRTNILTLSLVGKNGIHFENLIKSDTSSWSGNPTQIIKWYTSPNVCPFLKGRNQAQMED